MATPLQIFYSYLIVNFKDSLIKARLCGRNSISSSDLEQTFENLRIGKVYGAPSNPNWIFFGDQNLLCLDVSTNQVVMQI